MHCGLDRKAALARLHLLDAASAKSQLSLLPRCQKGGARGHAVPQALRGGEEVCTLESGAALEGAQSSAA